VDKCDKVNQIGKRSNNCSIEVNHLEVLRRGKKEMKRNMLSFVFLATLLAGALGIIGTAQAILFTGNTIEICKI